MKCPKCKKRQISFTKFLTKQPLAEFNCNNCNEPLKLTTFHRLYTKPIFSWLFGTVWGFFLFSILRDILKLGFIQTLFWLLISIIFLLIVLFVYWKRAELISNAQLEKKEN